MKKAASILILCGSAWSLSGCSILNTGPCTGFGCSAASKSGAATAQNSDGRQPPAKAQAQAVMSSEPQAKRGQ